MGSAEMKRLGTVCLLLVYLAGTIWAIDTHKLEQDIQTRLDKIRATLSRLESEHPAYQINNAFEQVSKRSAYQSSFPSLLAAPAVPPSPQPPIEPPKEEPSYSFVGNAQPDQVNQDPQQVTNGNLPPATQPAAGDVAPPKVEPPAALPAAPALLPSPTPPSESPKETPSYSFVGNAQPDQANQTNWNLPSATQPTAGDAAPPKTEPPVQAVAPVVPPSNPSLSEPPKEATSYSFVGKAQPEQPDQNPQQVINGNLSPATEPATVNVAPPKTEPPPAQAIGNQYAFVGTPTGQQTSNTEVTAPVNATGPQPDLTFMGDKPGETEGPVDLSFVGMTPNPMGSPSSNPPAPSAKGAVDASKSQGYAYPTYSAQDLDAELNMEKSMPSWPADVRAKFKNSYPYVEEIGYTSRKILSGVKDYKCPYVANVDCNDSILYDRYRTFDGRCNNKKNPMWGAFASPLARFFQPKYEDGYHMPRGARFKVGSGYLSRLPSARKVSAAIITSKNTTDETHTHAVMQFGQFLDHDFSSTAKSEYSCCDPKLRSKYVCFDIDLSGDEFFGNFSTPRDCMDFTRSYTHCGSTTKWLEQINVATSFLDASMIYGVTKEISDKLRSHSNGMMVMSKFLPHFLPNRNEVGMQAEPNLSGENFMSGDGRAESHPTILSTHTLWMREHNRIANLMLEQVKKRSPPFMADPQKLDEFIYQETRKIVAAQIQNIVYSDWLPAIFSSETRHKYNLEISPDSTYDPMANPSIRNEFATVAYRFGHSLVSDVFKGKNQPWRLGAFFGDPTFAIRENETNHGSENELEGMCSQPMMKMDRSITEELTHNLYLNKKVLNNDTEGRGFDLASLNIQRGRDHGVPDYNTIRGLLDMPIIDSMDNKPAEIDEEAWAAFKQVYTNPADIDLYPAGIAEMAIPGGGILGPTFTYMIGEQFKMLKNGDRFFYTHTKGPGAAGYPTDIQNMIMNIHLSDILCLNTHIESIQGNVFFLENAGNNAREACNPKQRAQKLDLGKIIDNAISHIG